MSLAVPEGMAGYTHPNEPGQFTTVLNATRDRNNEAALAIFDEYSPLIYSYALRLSNDPLLADQIVGDVFEKLLDKFAGGKGPEANLRSYLYETAYHLFVDETRYWNHNGDLTDENQRDAHIPLVQSQVERNIVLDNISQAMNILLTEDQRHVVILRFLEGFSLKETADIIGKEVNNVKVIQNRAIAKLRKILGGESIEDGMD